MNFENETVSQKAKIVVEWAYFKFLIVHFMLIIIIIGWEYINKKVIQGFFFLKMFPNGRVLIFIAFSFPIEQIWAEEN